MNPDSALPIIPHSLRWFVTGASGFIGRRLVEMLVAAGHQVVPHGPRISEKAAIVGNVPNLEKVQWMQRDLVKGEGLEAIGECDIVVHLAAAGVKASSRQWDLCTSVNVTGTQTLLSALGRCPTLPVLFFPRTFYQNHLAEVPALWENPYIATKEAATRLAERWLTQDRPDARVVFATFFQAYGLRDHPDNLVSYAIRQLRNGQPAQLGSGNAPRDWIYLDDLVTAILAAVAHVCNRANPPILRCDVGTGVGHSIREVVGEIARQLGVEAKATYDPGRDRSDSALSSLAKKHVPDWMPSHSLEAGLRMIIQE